VRRLNGDGQYGPAVEVELDLTSEHMAEFEDTIAPWLAVGLPPGGPQKPPQYPVPENQVKRHMTKRGSRLAAGGRVAPPPGRKTPLNPAEQRTKDMSRDETAEFLKELRAWARSTGREEEFMPLPGKSDYRYSRRLIDDYDDHLYGRSRAV
jgi:hypothetical protein